MYYRIDFSGYYVDGAEGGGDADDDDDVEAKDTT